MIGSLGLSMLASQKTSSLKDKILNAEDKPSGLIEKTPVQPETENKSGK